MLEFYQTYADYRDLMDLTEAMLREVVLQVKGSLQVTYQGESYDFEPAFQRLTIKESIAHYCADISLESLADMATVRDLCAQHNITVESGWGLGRLHVELFEALVEDKLKGPVFITEYPTEVSPLARRNEQDPSVTDRFEMFLGGREVANGFSELNDPDDQAERFLAQVADKDAGDLEAMHYDADYIQALEYGLPPTAGEGIGIDRLVMFLTDAASIRDVILFPHMRPQRSQDAHEG
jgi:lysyl-tRNA synthetase class 2